MLTTVIYICVCKLCGFRKVFFKNCIVVSCNSIKPHSHERQRLRVRLHLRQIANIVSMRMLRQKNGFYIHSLHLTHPIDAMLQFDTNANAHANVDARVNGP